MLYEDRGKHQGDDDAARAWATRQANNGTFPVPVRSVDQKTIEDDVGHSWSTNTPSSCSIPEAAEDSGVPWSATPHLNPIIGQGDNGDGGVPWPARATTGINTPLPTTLLPWYSRYKQYIPHGWYGQNSIGQKIVLIAVVVCVIFGTISSVIIFRHTQTHSLTSQHVTLSRTSTTTLPSGLASSGDNAQLMHTAFPQTVAPDQSFNVQLTYINNGTTTWSSGNGYTLACTMTACMQGNTLSLYTQHITPGQQYTFIVHLKASSTTGSYQLTWQMLHQGNGFGDTASVTIMVQAHPTPTPTASSTNTTGNNNSTNNNNPTNSSNPTSGTNPTGGSNSTGGNNPTNGVTPPAAGPPSTDNSLFVSGSLPVTTTPGQSFTIQLTFQNNGTNTWVGGNYALACNTTVANVNCMQGGTVGLGSNSIAPGQSFTFTLTLIAPATPAISYTTAWVMTDKGQAFGDTGATGTVNVLDVTPPPSVTPPPTPVDSATLVGQSANPTIQEGQQFSISFTLQNTGTTTWSDNGYTLACLSTCLNASNAGFNGQSVAQGQQFQFNIMQTAPITPGTYTTSWILQDNGTSFGPTLSLNVTVPAPPPPVATTPTPTWQPVLQQGAPDCNNPGGTSWNTPLSGTALSCGSGGLLMQQNSAVYYAELDLDQAGGGYYSQNNFRVQVQATFLNTSDTSTWAGVLVQTPAAAGVVGGFIFVLNPAGQWQLQQVVTGTNIPVVASGSIGINPGQATPMTVIVQNGTLYAFVNGTQVLTWGDTNNPSPGLVSLMVERLRAAPSSTVLYTNFELDKWS